MRASRGGVIGGLLGALVGNVCAAVVGGVGVLDVAVEARIGDTLAIAFADHGSGVDDGDDAVYGIFATSDARESAVGCVVGKGKKEIFSEGIEKGERGVVVLVLAVDGIVGKIV